MQLKFLVPAPARQRGEAREEQQHDQRRRPQREEDRDDRHDEDGESDERAQHERQRDAEPHEGAQVRAHDLGDLLLRQREMLADVEPHVVAVAPEKSAVPGTRVHGEETLTRNLPKSLTFAVEVARMPARRNTATRARSRSNPGKKGVYWFSTGKAKGNAGIPALPAGSGPW